MLLFNNAKHKMIRKIILIVNIFEIILKFHSIFFIFNLSMKYISLYKASFTFLLFLYFQALEELSLSRSRIVIGTATVLYVTNAKRRWSAKVSLWTKETSCARNVAAIRKRQASSSISNALKAEILNLDLSLFICSYFSKVEC